MLPAAPAPVPAVPEGAGSRQSPGASRQSPWEGRHSSAQLRRRPHQHGEYVALIHRLKNALRLGTDDTGEARGERGSGSLERQSGS